MKFVLCLIFIPCFVIDDDIFGTNVKQAVGAVEVSASSAWKALKDVVDKISKIANQNIPDHTKTCSLIDEFCIYQLCCVGYCASTSTCACVPNIGLCNINEDCCYGNCIKGHCVCGGKGAECRKSSDCCVGICRNGTCGICLIDQEACKQNSVCCRGKCDLTKKQCECGTSGDSCTSPRDCCGGTCDEGVCKCSRYNSACDPEMPNSCCFGTCGLSSTFEYRCRPSPLNAVCNADNDCHSSVCKKNRCSCNVVGEACYFGEQQCCEGLKCNGIVCKTD